MSNKGQAMVEFVIVLPVFLFLALGMIDLGNILYQKYQLENDLDFVTTLYNEGKEVEINNYLTNKQIQIKYYNDDIYKNIELSKKVNITTPGLNLVFENPYYIKVVRYVYEQ